MNRAPWPAARSISDRALSQLPSSSEVQVSWTTAARNMGALVAHSDRAVTPAPRRRHPFRRSWQAERTRRLEGSTPMLYTTALIATTSLFLTLLATGNALL